MLPLSLRLLHCRLLLLILLPCVLLHIVRLQRSIRISANAQGRRQGTKVIPGHFPILCAYRGTASATAEHIVSGVRHEYLHHGWIHLHASRPWGHVGHNLGILLRLLPLLQLAGQRRLRWIGPRVPHLPRLPGRPVAHGAGHGHVGHWLPWPQALISLLPGNNVDLRHHLQLIAQLNTSSRGTASKPSRWMYKVLPSLVQRWIQGVRQGAGHTRKSKMSVRVMAAAMSLRCSVRRLFSSEWFQERSVSSRMNISHACRQQHVLSPGCLLRSFILSLMYKVNLSSSFQWKRNP